MDIHLSGFSLPNFLSDDTYLLLDTNYVSGWKHTSVTKLARDNLASQLFKTRQIVCFYPAGVYFASPVTFYHNVTRPVHFAVQREQLINLE